VPIAIAAAVILVAVRSRPSHGPCHQHLPTAHASYWTDDGAVKAYHRGELRTSNCKFNTGPLVTEYTSSSVVLRPLVSGSYISDMMMTIHSRLKVSCSPTLIPLNSMS